MGESLEEKLLGGAAYRIFVDETAKHLSALAELLHQTTWTEEGIRGASARCHTIRGGAGFFRLTDVAARAGEIEGLLRDISLADFGRELERVTAMFEALRVAAGNMPQPRG